MLRERHEAVIENDGVGYYPWRVGCVCGWAGRRSHSYGAARGKYHEHVDEVEHPRKTVQPKPCTPRSRLPKPLRS